MSGRVLHLLSQQPMQTGSGVTLDALAAQARQSGWEQRFLVGLPAGEKLPAIGGEAPTKVSAVRFGDQRLPFAVVGMSDVMPYESTRFSSLDDAMIARYRNAWSEAIRDAIRAFDPDVIHSHHIWLMSSLVAELSEVPTVLHCHGTGLRQQQLCPHLADGVVRGCSGQHVVALHPAQRDVLVNRVGFSRSRTSVVGAGYRTDVFRVDPSKKRDPQAIVYAGKLSRAKGVMELLTAFAGMDKGILHIAGGGAGAEAEEIRRQCEGLGDRVIVHGRLDQTSLAELFNHATIFVLPSYYEGLPLVVVEALACGARVVATELPGIRASIAPSIEDGLELVPLPALQGPDTPEPSEVPAFVERLRGAMNRGLERGAVHNSTERFTWSTVFERVEAVWKLAMSEIPS